MSKVDALLRFSYQKRPVAKYFADHSEDQTPSGLEEERRPPGSYNMAKVSYLCKLYPEVPRDVVKKVVDRFSTIDAAQNALLHYIDTSRNKKRKRVRVASNSSDEGKDAEAPICSADRQVPSNDPKPSAEKIPQMKRLSSSGRDNKGECQGATVCPVDDEQPAGCSRSDEESSADGEGESDDEDGLALTSTHKMLVLDFINGASLNDMLGVPTCSQKRAGVILAIRPFSSWSDLKEKFLSTPCLNMTIIQKCWQVLEMRQHVTSLMNECQEIATRISQRVENLLSAISLDAGQGHIVEQPGIISSARRLTRYQMVGLNWLMLMYSEKVNALLADEMGLGKTCQVIAFLAHLLETFNERGPHIIVVPTSTLDNWSRELHTWCPSLKHLIYAGNQRERAELRQDFKDGAGEDGAFNVLLTTYDNITSTAADRALYKKNEFHCAVFDEAHALKNMASQRYTNLMKVQARHRLLLTGTPVQNNLVELMSLLRFVMPHVFCGKEHNLIKFFTSMNRNDDDTSRMTHVRQQVVHAKKIMEPFVLRRLKKQILTELPKKDSSVQSCVLSGRQLNEYVNLKDKLKSQAEGEGNLLLPKNNSQNICMQLRKAANHCLLSRTLYNADRLQAMAARLVMDPSHRDAEKDLVVQDMEVMSDFELHQLCQRYKCLAEYSLSTEHIVTSAKFLYLDSLLPELHAKDERVLIFSQFTSMLSILEAYLAARNHTYLRLDGSTSGAERQQLIDRFNNEPEIFIFLLSTKAGGVGINLTSASCVVIHDIDYNPYNDRQAEDRCHRLGQTRDVKVIRLVAEGTIEGAMLQVGLDKLKLDEDIRQNSDSDCKENADFPSAVLKLMLS